MYSRHTLFMKLQLKPAFSSCQRKRKIIRSAGVRNNRVSIKIILNYWWEFVGGAVASWLVRSTPDRAVWVRALAGYTVLCSWARHLTLTVPPSTQEYKWVPATCWGNLTNCRGLTCDALASCPGGVEILLAASCYGNRDKLR